jgi:hypothetical protein
MKESQIGRACSTYTGEEMRLRDFGYKREGKRSLDRTRRRCERDIKMIVKK